MNYEPAQRAVCCLLMDKDGKILAISRGENTDEMGMPGGKVQPDESLEIAAVRETFEETGYVVAAPEPVYTAFVPGEINTICTVFVAHVVAQAPDAPRSIPFEGIVKWVEPIVLVKGPFGEYNRALFEHLNIPWITEEMEQAWASDRESN